MQLRTQTKKIKTEFHGEISSSVVLTKWYEKVYPNEHQHGILYFCVIHNAWALNISGSYFISSSQSNDNLLWKYLNSFNSMICLFDSSFYFIKYIANVISFDIISFSLHGKEIQANTRFVETNLLNMFSNVSCLISIELILVKKDFFSMLPKVEISH